MKTAHRPNTLASWIEMSQGYLEDGPPKRNDYGAWLFINHCEVRVRKSGVRYLIRNTSVEFIRETSKRKRSEAVMAFVERADVRLLVEGLEANDFDALPRQTNDPDQSIIDGTSDLYAPKEWSEELA